MNAILRSKKSVPSANVALESARHSFRRWLMLVPVSAAICTPVASSIAGSTGASGTTITQITYFEGKNPAGGDGVALIWTAAVDSNRPGCASGTWQNTFAVNLGSTGGAAIIASAITAQAQGRIVFVTGTGACSLTGISEDLANINIQ